MAISEWVSGRVFKFVHGNNLVYNTCWEDPRLDRQALELTSQDRVMVITSAGCNALDYLLAGAGHVYAFADPGFPIPTFSVYEERMHSWVSLPAGIEHMA